VRGFAVVALDVPNSHRVGERRWVSSMVVWICVTGLPPFDNCRAGFCRG